MVEPGRASDVRCLTPTVPPLPPPFLLNLLQQLTLLFPLFPPQIHHTSAILFKIIVSPFSSCSTFLSINITQTIFPPPSLTPPAKLGVFVLCTACSSLNQPLMSDPGNISSAHPRLHNTGIIFLKFLGNSSAFK